METPTSELRTGLAICCHLRGWRFNPILQTLRNSQKSQHSLVLRAHHSLQLPLQQPLQLPICTPCSCQGDNSLLHSVHCPVTYPLWPFVRVLLLPRSALPNLLWAVPLNKPRGVLLKISIAHRLHSACIYQACGHAEQSAGWQGDREEWTASLPASGSHSGRQVNRCTSGWEVAVHGAVAKRTSSRVRLAPVSPGFVTHQLREPKQVT